ncbi:MAG: DUF1800 domain-containing protein, partial [Bacteroidota bacterium]
MDRRAFLRGPQLAPRVATVQEVSTNMIEGDLTPYNGPWDATCASHLLRRTTFGPLPNEIQQAVSLGLSGTLNRLFQNQAMPSPPVHYDYDKDGKAREGQTWVEAALDNGGDDNARMRSLRAWTVGLMLQGGMNIREKLVLFWINHFSIQEGDAGESRYAYQYMNILRSKAKGSFKELVEDITLSPAMLKYLNGEQNVKGRPNENYARELFELFTIGKGPLVAEGNYTHFTEQDVQEAAEVLTGWHIATKKNDPGVPQSAFRPDKHETRGKKFSPAYEEQVIADGGENEYKLLINMIFQQRETARHICRKLYRWFVYYVIDERVEQDIIEPMADILINNDFNIEAPLRALLESTHFFAEQSRGCLIKHPLDMLISAMRQTETPLPPASEYVTQYKIWDNLFDEAKDLQMEILNPPDVAGWPAYYQKPQYHQIWVNSVTLPIRMAFLSRLVNRGFDENDFKVQVDTLALVETVSDPLDAPTLIAEWTARFFPYPITQPQQDSLREVLIPGLPNFEWTVEYMEYLAEPNDEMIRKSVQAKLDALLEWILK